MRARPSSSSGNPCRLLRLFEPRVRSVLDLKHGTVAVGPSIVSEALVTAVTPMSVSTAPDAARQPLSAGGGGSSPTGRSMRCWGFRPSPKNCGREDRPRGGHTRADRPWSQYFCCMAVANVTFVKSIGGLKRMLRAFMKAADLCLRPDRVARFLVDRDFVRNHPTLCRL